MTTRGIKILLIGTFLYIIVAVFITPSLVQSAYDYRGYFALGGEWVFMLAIPFVLIGTSVEYIKYIEGGNSYRSRKNL